MVSIKGGSARRIATGQGTAPKFPAVFKPKTLAFHEPKLPTITEPKLPSYPKANAKKPKQTPGPRATLLKVIEAKRAASAPGGRSSGIRGPNAQPGIKVGVAEPMPNPRS